MIAAQIIVEAFDAALVCSLELDDRLVALEVADLTEAGHGA